MDVRHYAAVAGSGVYSLGHLVSVNATTTRASHDQHALTGFSAANCHIPGKFMSCLAYHIVVTHKTV